MGGLTGEGYLCNPALHTGRYIIPVETLAADGVAHGGGRRAAGGGRRAAGGGRRAASGERRAAGGERRAAGGGRRANSSTVVPPSALASCFPLPSLAARRPPTPISALRSDPASPRAARAR